MDELIMNSIDSKASEIKIVINLREYSITVKDDGIGITAEEMEKIGKRYYSSKSMGSENGKEMTLGYQGEALSSIGQVSLLEIISNERERRRQNRKVIRGGQVILNVSEEPNDTHTKATQMKKVH
ncbi:hypothetical protein RFI_31566 [Reticulomyxa filosa]|uniref:Histidine kinase/HSP90-like ATPase domain-containing protein n=1 Tax=Reticulomyxa filosa TaxID=46433 RepID=X6LYM9_RETFI|nr:hypothetical protein RFI_31566 [Reticulomyxa filosa]|eukprot:ETO05830.1 hypothetical protein RFI_31566 [Reticulomyxa filosa]